MGSIIYTPDAGYAGTDQVSIGVQSQRTPTLCDDGTLTITVTAAVLAGDAPETDTQITTPVGPVPRGVLPVVAVVFLVLAAFVGGAAAAAAADPSDASQPSGGASPGARRSTWSVWPPARRL